MEDFWIAFCGESNCSDTSQEPCSASFKFLTRPTSCVNHAVIICFDVILLALLIFNMIRNTSPKISPPLQGRYKRFLCLQVASAAFNGCLGLVYFCSAIWVLEEKLKKSESLLPLHRWTLVFRQGFTWFSVGLTVSLRGMNLPKTPLRLLSIFAFLTAGIVGLLSPLSSLLNKQASFKGGLDVLSFIGAILLLLCSYKGSKREESDDIFDNMSSLYTPLNGDDTIGIDKADSPYQVTSFTKAGFLSRLSFW